MKGHTSSKLYVLELDPGLECHRIWLEGLYTGVLSRLHLESLDVGKLCELYPRTNGRGDSNALVEIVRRTRLDAMTCVLWRGGLLPEILYLSYTSLHHI